MSEENVTPVEELSGPSPDVVAKARQLGWADKESFKGDPEKWIDADLYVERGETVLPYLRASNAKLLNEMTELRRLYAEKDNDIAAMREFIKKSDEGAYKRAMNDLREQKANALEEGDHRKVVALDEAMGELKEMQKVPTSTPSPAAPPPVPPEFVEFVRDNSWYQTDPRIYTAAAGYAEIVRRELPHLNGRQFLEEIDRRMTEDMPKVFEKYKPAPRRSPVDTSSRGGVSGGKKTAVNLPAEDRKQMEKFIKQGLFKNADEYLAHYEWE